MSTFSYILCFSAAAFGIRQATLLWRAGKHFASNVVLYLAVALWLGALVLIILNADGDCCAPGVEAAPEQQIVQTLKG